MAKARAVWFASSVAAAAKRLRWLAVCALAACTASQAGSAGPGDGDDVAESLRPQLCERAGDDLVRDLFCAGSGEGQPSIHSLAELQRALGFREASDPAQYVFLAHSTALAGKLVSPINPRMIALTPELQLAFHRGVQQVELTTRDRSTQRTKLYLLQFEQACNAAAAGCKPADLYTARIESSWTQLALQDDEDLKNTPADCRQCHQRATAEPSLLMRELEGPWTHFFAPADENTEPAAFPEPPGCDLFQDYVRAKGDEAYGGVPTSLMGKTIGFTLQTAVSSAQPLIFEGAIIAHERWPYRQNEGYASEAQRSPTWDASYAAFKRAERLALPYFAARVSDPDKQAQLTAAYRSYQQHVLSDDELPDLSNIYPDDPMTRAEIGLQNEPGATAVELLIQVCAPCHNDVLDQTLSRARFNIALSHIDAKERVLAADRVALPANAAGAMPPATARQLDEDARMRLLAYLRQDSRPYADDESLERAAALGMAQPPDERVQ